MSTPHSPTDIVPVGPLASRLGDITAFYYHYMSEFPPGEVTEDLLDWDGGCFGTIETKESCRAFSDWQQQPADTPITIDYVFTFITGLGNLLSRLEQINGDGDSGSWTEETIMSEFYEAAKATFGDEKASIRKFFTMCYYLTTNTPNGPRWGQFVYILSLEKFVDLLRDRLENPIGYIFNTNTG